MVSSSIQINFVTASNLYDKKNVSTWNYVMDEKDREKYVKKYKYLDTSDDQIKEFKSCDFLTHLHYGLVFNKTDQKTWQSRPIDKVNFRLIENDTKILVRCDASQHLDFHLWLYEWENKIMAYNFFQKKMVLVSNWLGTALLSFNIPVWSFKRKYMICLDLPLQIIF